MKSIIFMFIIFVFLNVLLFSQSNIGEIFSNASQGAARREMEQKRLDMGS